MYVSASTVNANFLSIQPGGSQEHISLITNSFLMILHSSSNSSVNMVLKFLAQEGALVIISQFCRLS